MKAQNSHVFKFLTCARSFLAWLINVDKMTKFINIALPHFIDYIWIGLLNLLLGTSYSFFVLFLKNMIKFSSVCLCCMIQYTNIHRTCLWPFIPRIIVIFILPTPPFSSNIKEILIKFTQASSCTKSPRYWMVGWFHPLWRQDSLRKVIFTKCRIPMFPTLVKLFQPIIVTTVVFCNQPRVIHGKKWCQWIILPFEVNPLYFAVNLSYCIYVYIES